MQTICDTPTRPAPPPRTGLRRLPHCLLFAIINIGYCGPVLLAYALGYSEGGVAETLDISSSLIVDFGLIYFLAVVAFWAGAVLMEKFGWITTLRSARHYQQSIALFGIKFMTSAVCIALIVTKLLLIPAGIYSSYAFDSNQMTGGVWSMSMALSEVLVALLLALLVGTRRITSPWFIAAFLCLSINLLHGTRIFDVVIVVGVVCYYWITTEFDARRLRKLLFSLALAVAVLYVVFSSRAQYLYSDDSTGWTVAISPVVYEAVFSQTSLFRFLDNYSVSLVGDPVGFIADAVSFTLPRFLNPEKDVGGTLQPYAWLSPLGAFAGHAAGLIYFGYMLPVFYFLLGAFASWLQRMSRRDSYFFVVYIYFISDILLRLMRDGFIYPVKYLVDSCGVLVMAALLSSLLSAASTRYLRRAAT